MDWTAGIMVAQAARPSATRVRARWAASLGLSAVVRTIRAAGWDGEVASGMGASTASVRLPATGYPSPSPRRVVWWKFSLLSEMQPRFYRNYPILLKLNLKIFIGKNLPASEFVCECSRLRQLWEKLGEVAQMLPSG